MNLFIETLNHWGGNFLSFAWPMLWQSSLLIAFVFTLDFLSARKIRASLRYALWLAVLVKLLLPPTLAMPTSAAWWLFQSKPAGEAPAIKQYVVTYGSTASQSDFVRQVSPVRAPEPKLNSAGRVLLASITVSAGLLLWLVFRWRQVMRKVGDATVNTELDGTLEAAQQMAGLRTRVRLKMVDDRMSPAVCGLFNPVILLPRILVEKLSAGQLRAVLLHELFHLRRKDVWANCAQALLQIAYWWHPLLWLANTRIRRVREEAVDDAVMLSLRHEAESYAPTLLEVAKLAFVRPQLSLGLVGIMESRSALRQRIEHLVDFRPPRKAGLTLLSLCGIFVFSAVALPMGQAPAESTNPTLSGQGRDLEQSNLNVSITNHFPNSTNVFEDKMKANDLARDAKLLYEMGKFDQAEERLKSALTLEPDNQAAQYYMNLVQAAKAGRRTGMVQTSAARKAIVDKLNRIQFDQFGPNIRWPLSKVVQELNQLTAGLASDRSGIRFFTADNSVVITIDPPLTNATLANVLATIVTSSDKPIQYAIFEEGIVFSSGNSRETPRLYSRAFKLNHPVSEDELRKTLLAAGVTNPPTTYLYTDSGLFMVHGSEAQLARVNRVVLKLNGFSAKEIGEGDAASTKYPSEVAATAENSTNLFSRTFMVDAHAFPDALRNIPGLETNDVVAMARSLFSKLGVDLKPPETVFYTDRLGLLFVRATMQDLDTIERAIQTLNLAPPQIHIKARFLQVPKGTVNGFRFTKIIGSTNQPDQFVGILTSENAKAVLKTLESQPGAEILAEPEVTTLNGRQTQMRSTQIITVITNFAFRETSTNSYVFPQTNPVETGPILDVVPHALSDGYTILLTVIPSLTEFLGYDKTTNTAAAYNKAGEKIDLPTISPSFGVRKTSAQVELWDGQTVVLGPLKTRFYDGGKEVDAEPNYFAKAKAARGQPDETDKELLVFITVNLVDPAGNRVHSDDEMPFAKNSIPAQDSP